MKKKVDHVVNRTIFNGGVIVWQSITTAGRVVGMPAVGVDLDYVWDLPEDCAHDDRWVYLFLLDLLQVVVNAPTITDPQSSRHVTCPLAGWLAVILWLWKCQSVEHQTG
ncbi:hypothetical protein M405DRAFT_808676 [Rhizopogon salebrosus TDB-379]|jgi:hypothetical protein|nr:hypothetical protein M405DRAFT_808676 [Rhizopogon salebrosus TDB-379]